MKNINRHRVFHRNDLSPNSEGDYVVYWMQLGHRLQYNYALEYAVGWANKLGKPLLLYEELKNDYPWASDRIHQFYLEGMQEVQQYALKHDLNYLSFVEEESGTNKQAYLEVFSNACYLVTDEFPVYFIRERNRWLGENLDIPVTTVDNNGIIPLGLTDKDPYSAYFFRKIVQKHFVECYTHPPKKNPLEELENRNTLDIDAIRKKLPTSGNIPNNITSFLGEQPIDHEVKPLEIKGTRQAALGKLGQFVQYGLMDYGDKRNDPDENKVSGMSPWLHFGKISEYEIVKTVLDHQPKGWDLGDISYNDGSRGQFWNGESNISKYLDELITWREVGFHFAHHRPDYAEFDSLPDWALETLMDHKDDPREWVYSYEQFEKAQTHDELWNAAQRQLRQEGIIHNYLRMLWGKKILEWTPDPQTALKFMIELNNKFAIDGRDPNSYSGIFWCLGRFDRAWQERPIYGKVRYMTSVSTRRKVKLTQYLDRFGNQQELL
ncbi:hypothetical protein NC796_17335 [Aliifodinibius sp. S!AR15-10]|uniref:hypothetical protein n=1 Tax=Aliifodinibius sp. S!AR15-10 TaxID=2950437 RepID=UPI002863D8AF|nr:hypothetical protein [Aliifodinibius sp. S!AR15-10]MDR8392923.1 hypothetical protein [Aliifodinibius sp. S!AR15-10]